MPRSCLRRLAALTPLLFLACGCTKTKVFTTAPFEPGADAAVTRLAPRDALYKVKWFDREKQELHAIHGTDCIVFAGQRIGFAPNPDGGVLAFAGDEEFPVRRLSPRAAYCVWVAKVKKETMLARRMRRAGDAAVAGGRLVAGAAVLAAEGYLDGLGDEDCDDEDGDEPDRKRDKGKAKKDSPPRDREAAPYVPAGPLPPEAP